jgi:hypothetical protein
MADPKDAERTILKVLAGAQAGVEVYLEPAEYSVGTGPDDDIQFVDVTMKPGHVRVRLGPGKIEIRAGSGSFVTAAGLRSNDQDWQEIQPLDVITTGTTRFAFGPPTAKWATIADHGDIASAPPSTTATARTGVLGAFDRFRFLSIPAAFVGGAALIAILFLAFGVGRAFTPAAQPQDDVAAIRKALDQLPFAHSIAVNKDVDGQVFVTGYVESPPERRAVTGAIEDTGVAVNLRLGVLEVLKSEIDGLIKADKVNVTYQLSSSGDLTLDGVILDSAAAERFVTETSQTVIGLDKVVSKIRTAESLLVEIRDLAHLSQIDDAVVFRLNGMIVEANGVISTNKIDPWVGFLQAYSRRLGELIGLRSFVQLQSDSGAGVVATPTLPQMPLMIGALPDGLDADIDLARLRSGDFDARETFAGPRGAAPTLSRIGPPAPLARPASSGPHFALGPIASAQLDEDPGSTDPFGPAALVGAFDRTAANAEKEGLTSTISVRAPATGGDRSPQSPTADSGPPALPRPTNPSSTPGHAPASQTPAPAATMTAADLDDISHRADNLMTRWLGGGLGNDGSDDDRSSAIASALDTLAQASLGLAKAAPAPKAHAAAPAPPPPVELSEKEKELFAHKYLPLFALSQDPSVDPAVACRRGSRLTPHELPAVLFSWI